MTEVAAVNEIMEQGTSGGALVWATIQKRIASEYEKICEELDIPNILINDI